MAKRRSFRCPRARPAQDVARFGQEEAPHLGPVVRREHRRVRFRLGVLEVGKTPRDVYGVEGDPHGFPSERHERIPGGHTGPRQEVEVHEILAAPTLAHGNQFHAGDIQQRGQRHPPRTRNQFTHETVRVVEQAHADVIHARPERTLDPPVPLPPCQVPRGRRSRPRSTSLPPRNRSRSTDFRCPNCRCQGSTAGQVEPGQRRQPAKTAQKPVHRPIDHIHEQRRTAS